MGLIRNMKAGVVENDAARAFAAGAGVFTPRLNYPATHSPASGGIADWSQMVDAIEAVGWRLEHWSVASDAKGRPEAYPLFRRA
jgi:hypothetical protein